MEDSVSILMPVKDTERYLPRCLDSILEQSHASWELLAVDDDSSDGSYELLCEYARKDERIIPLRNSNKGIITALRQGYAAASGSLITRMDSDDYMPPQKLERMVETLLRQGNGHLSVGQVEYFSDGQLGNGYLRYAQWLNKLTDEARNFEEIYRECVIPSPCWMLHRSDLEACGAFRPDVYPEDYDLCFRFYEQGLRIIPISETLHYWRDHALRSSRNDPHYADNRFSALKLDYFLRLDRNPKRPLLLWGAGGKGKLIAKGLLERKASFRWICNNPRKIGKDIYDTRMEHYEIIQQMAGAQIIIAVSSPDEQASIKIWLKELNVEGYFFC